MSERKRRRVEIEDSEAEERKLAVETWEKIKPIVQGSLSSACLEGSSFPTLGEMKMYERVKRHLKRHIKPTKKRSTYLHLDVVHNIVARAIGNEKYVTKALIAAAIWELKLCSRTDWSMQAKTDKMFLMGQFIKNDHALRLAPENPIADPSVPCRFRLRLVAAASMIYSHFSDEHPALGPAFHFITRGFDVLLKPVYDYYQQACLHTAKWSETISAEEWARETFVLEDLIHTLEADPLDNLTLQPKPLSLEFTVDFEDIPPAELWKDYVWMIAVAVYLASMEKQSFATDIIMTDEIDSFEEAGTWRAVRVPVET